MRSAARIILRASTFVNQIHREGPPAPENARLLDAKALVYPTYIMTHSRVSSDPSDLQQINAQIRDRCFPLPGSQPYDNIRPINVPGRFDKRLLFEVMCEMHPHLSKQDWRRIFSDGRISKNGQVVGPNQRVRGGEQFQHLFPDTVEDDVNADIRAIFVDDDLLVVAKPAPLPMHPSGRFNLNTMLPLLKRVFTAGDLLPVHRLDANTSGVVVLARHRNAARSIQQQFEHGNIQKSYVAICHGEPNQERFECQARISKQVGRTGGRQTAADGQPAHTKFTVVNLRGDGRTRIEAQPITGRTNQIRLHLWSLGMPIVGDPLYLPQQQMGQSQTLPLGSPPMCLHAAKITLQHPSNQASQCFTAQTPAWWQ